MSLKNPVTPPGIDPGTVRLVVQHLNHYITPGPIISKGKGEFWLCTQQCCIQWGRRDIKKSGQVEYWIMNTEYDFLIISISYLLTDS